MISLHRSAAAMCAVAVGTATLSVTLAGSALADDITPEEGVPAVLTGIAWDARTREVLTVDEDGTIVGVQADTGVTRPVPFTGPVESVQGLAMFEDLLWIGDMGDPEAARDVITVYRIDSVADVTNYRAWDFLYPDGAHDSKALALSGKGRIYFVTDGENPGIYRAVLQPSRTGVNTLVRVADAPTGVTDAVFLDDGVTLMLRTAVGVEVFNAFSWESEALTTYVGGAVGESLTTFDAERMLVGGSEVLLDEPLPVGRTTVTPTASARPTPSPSPSPSPSAEPVPAESTAPEEPAAEAVSRRGTVMALIGAGVVAVLAGAVVFVVRD